MDEKLKIKYVFQKHHGLQSLTPEDTRTVRREIRDFLSELKEYSIDVSDLCRIRLNYSDRNNVLNIALILINDEETATYLVTRKKFPVNLTSRKLKTPTAIIDSYKEYLTAYMLLFGSSRYSTIVRHLGIGTTFDGSEKGDDRYRGLLLKDMAVASCVLTPQGEFRYLDIEEDASAGEMVTGKDAVINPARVRLFTIMSVLLTCGLIFSVWLFTQPYRNVHLISGSHVEFIYNRLGRLSEIRGLNSSGAEAVKNTVFSDKKLDSSLSEFISSSVQSGLSDPYNMTLIVMDGEFFPEEFQGENLKRVVKEKGIHLKINLKNGNALFIE